MADINDILNKILAEAQQINGVFSSTLNGEGSFTANIEKAHKKMNAYTLGLMVGTFILATVTGFLWWETRKAGIENNIQSNNQKRAEFSYSIWKDFQEFMYNDTFVNKYYYNDDTLIRPGQIDSTVLYRKSICKFLNYFETLYTLYKDDKVNEHIIKSLFENPITRSYNHVVIQNYIKYKRDKMRLDKKNYIGLQPNYPVIDTTAGTTFDALSLWAGKFQADMGIECRKINISDEKFYRIDEKCTDSFYKKLPISRGGY